MLCLLCWKTLQEILDIRTIVPPIHFRLLPAATTAAASQGALTKEGIHRCQTTRNIAGCTEGIACHYLTGICPDGSLWQGCCCCCFPYTKAHKRSEFKLAEGWVCSHCSTWPSGWLNHSIRQMWLSLLPPSKCFLLTWWDKTAQHSWVKHHFSKADRAALCNWKWTFQTGSSAWQFVLLGKWSLSDCPYIKCLYWEVQKSPCIKLTMAMSLYF